jgi:hypothetical protein
MLTPIALTAGYEDYRSPALIIALIWAVVAGAQCHPWFVAQVRAFRRREPAERREPVEAPGTSEPPSPTPAAEDTS